MADSCLVVIDLPFCFLCVRLHSAPYFSSITMALVSGIQNQILDVTVVGCSKLRDTELFSRQDPYVCIEYANSKFRTRTCTDGSKNPTFQEKFQIPLVEGLREMNVTVWNSNTLRSDDFIGSGRIQLQKVLSQGYDDNSWPLQTRHSKYAGDVKVIMHFQKASQQKPAATPPSGPPYVPGAPPPAYPPPYAPYAPTAYPGASAYSMYPPPVPSPYPSSPYPPPPQGYPTQTYPPAPYPPESYPPQYPPPPAQPYYPPGPYPGSHYPPY
ncbi:protein SRC2 homolog isoform X1 [Zingiber officinale]|uniref:protein SRC2 homolog isoform X1 n=1 Tax=Zingiber officinale TaxID=94328 RepID=UPI001C4A9C3B|nr:protein SRC2 homolog isoform X1 [Zingiber officinale]XP_042428085.1 protein SRC2 homolog isoform X1 [Zingiber officinale]